MGVLTTGNQRPKGLNAFSSRIYAVLEAPLVCPWHMLASSCSWRGIDPLELSASDLSRLIPLLGEQAARVSDDEHALKLMHSLEALVHQPDEP